MKKFGPHFYIFTEIKRVGVYTDIGYRVHVWLAVRHLNKNAYASEIEMHIYLMGNVSLCTMSVGQHLIARSSRCNRENKFYVCKPRENRKKCNINKYFCFVQLSRINFNPKIEKKFISIEKEMLKTREMKKKKQITF